MGFDIYGVKELESGEENYFRNNCWWWRPLWDLCNFLQCLEEEQYDQGGYNNGFLIDERTSIKIYMQLTVFLNSPLRDDMIKGINEKDTHYRIDVGNIKEFSDFCRISGGFKIY